MHRRRGEKRDNWLLIKSEDEAARGPNDPDILEEKPKSVVSGRTIEKIAAAEGDAVWQSNSPVAENVKQIKKAKKKPGESKDHKEESAAARNKRNRAPTRGRRRCCATKPARRGAPSLLHSAAACHSPRRCAGRRTMDPRGEVRRLSHAGAARGRKGQAAHAQGLDWTQNSSRSRMRSPGSMPTAR